LSAAGDKAEIMYSAFADVKILQFNSLSLVPNIVEKISVEIFAGKTAGL
jgi:hypothetical protein